MPSRLNSSVILSEMDKTGKKTKSSKKDKTNTERIPEYVPDIPEPTSRAELMKYWMDLSLDSRTANKMLWISDNCSKACRRTAEVCPVLDGPQRYECSPQVLCKEVIWKERAYWEVEYTGWVVIGATYEGTARRVSEQPSGLGDNEESWGLCWAGSRFEIWFNGLGKDISDVPFCSTIGVYIDQPAGILNYYIVAGEGAEREVKPLHKVKTSSDKKIIPGFWMGIQSSCTLLKRQE